MRGRLQDSLVLCGRRCHRQVLLTKVLGRRKCRYCKKVRYCRVALRCAMLCCAVHATSCRWWTGALLLPLPLLAPLLLQFPFLQ